MGPGFVVFSVLLYNKRPLLVKLTYCAFNGQLSVKGNLPMDVAIQHLFLLTIVNNIVVFKG